ncbi:hypothetical protein D3C78_937220 [compost metagenome]
MRRHGQGALNPGDQCIHRFRLDQRGNARVLVAQQPQAGIGIGGDQRVAAHREDVGQLGGQHGIGRTALLDDQVAIGRGEQRRQILVGLQRCEPHVAQSLALDQLQQAGLAGAFADDQEQQIAAPLQALGGLDHRLQALLLADVAGVEQYPLAGLHAQAVE